MAHAVRPSANVFCGANGINIRTQPLTWRSSFCSGVLRADSVRNVKFAQGSRKGMQPPQGEAVKILPDVGLLVDTFITPCLRNQPNPFTSPRRFLRLQWLHLKTRLVDRLALLGMKLTSPRGTYWWQRDLRIDRRHTLSTAIRMHQNMYHAFSKGNVATLNAMCSMGLRINLRTRLSRRQPGETIEWQILKTHRKPRLISDRMGRLPGEGNALRQCVVKFNTQQKTSRLVSGNVLPGGERIKDTVEYFVIQRLYDQWKGQQWQIWGTAEETTLESFEAARRVHYAQQEEETKKHAKKTIHEQIHTGSSVRSGFMA